ncbi:MAG: MotA/TolQ/ExbB proton channel family protein [Verrucomicrobia bacterium]|nr:MotA/TolQ/ExbB proton channel family protein [Verrucomicrobiota bacterium]MDA1064964.1 MotA/TolQ/ExbB proton channel family protein [Verrucomicrobiota bacterium]
MAGLDLSILEKGGPIMWVLLLMSLISFIIFVERVLFLHRGQIRSSEFVTGIKNIVRKQRLVEALTLCEETPGPVPSLIKASLLHFGEQEEKIRYGIQEAALVEIPVLEKRLGTLIAMAKSAPLVGLLGTVLGLAQTFYDMEQGGNYSNATVLANGMWQSLITTACGLAIAVLSYLGFHFLHGRVRALVRDMEWTGNEMLKFIVSDLRDEGITPTMGEEAE